MAGNTAVPGASLVGRVMAVLNCFGVGRTELTLTQIATRSGLPLSTVRRVTMELESGGYLERLVNKRYRVGIRLWEIGSIAPQQRGLREAAQPGMHDLYAATQENVQLVVVEGNEALCIEKISGSAATPTMTEVGGRLQLHATAVGKCLLAFSGTGLVRAVTEAGLSPHTEYTITEPARLARTLREVRRTGLAYSREEMTIGAVSVAAPVIGPGGVLRGALGVVVKASATLDRLTPAVRTAALGIGRATIGCRLCRGKALRESRLSSTRSRAYDGPFSRESSSPASG
jgi:DNA-binding IclR family transcriptional regulator